MSDTITNAKAREALDHLLEALKDLKTLRIETALVAMEMKPIDNGEFELQPKPGDAVGIVTEIQFLEGDIAARMSAEMLDDKNKPLLEAHAARVADSREIMHGNIKAVVDLLTGLIKG